MSNGNKYEKNKTSSEGNSYSRHQNSYEEDFKKHMNKKKCLIESLNRTLLYNLIEIESGREYTVN